MKPTNEQVLAWAREAGYTKVDPTKNPIEILERFAALAYTAGAKSMQERCAKECEIEAAVAVVNAHEAYQAGREMGATVCAAAIRALGDDDD